MFKTKNDRTRLTSKWAICGSKQSRFVEQKEAKELLSSFGIKKPLNKILLLISSLGIKTPLNKIPLLGDILF